MQRAAFDGKGSVFFRDGPAGGTGQGRVAVGGLLGIVIVWNASLALLGPEFTPLVVPSLGATAVLVDTGGRAGGCAPQYRR